MWAGCFYPAKHFKGVPRKRGAFFFGESALLLFYARWASVSQPQRRLRDWPRVRRSEQRGVPTLIVDVEIDDHL